MHLEDNTSSTASVLIKPFTGVGNKPAPIGYEPGFDFGLKHNGYSIFPHTAQSSRVPIINRRYNTGLDEKATSVYLIRDEKEKQSKIESIVKKRTELEQKLGRSLSLDDEDGIEFWDEYTYTISDEPMQLDLGDPNDELKYIVIMANTSNNKVATSFSEAEVGGYWFYVENKEVERGLELKRTEVFDNSIAKYIELKNTDSILLREICKYLLRNANKEDYSLVDMKVVYKDLRDYIDGAFNKEKKSKESFALEFLNAVDMDRMELMTRNIIDTALRYSIIRFDEGERKYYNKVNGLRYGRTVEDIYKYLSDPRNEAELGDESPNAKDDSIYRQVLTNSKLFNK